MRNKIFIISLIFFLCIVLIPIAKSSSVTYDDEYQGNYVESYDINTNSKTSSPPFDTENNVDRRLPLIRFGDGAVDWTTKTIASIRLRLYVVPEYDASSDGYINVNYFSTSYNPDTVTYNNMPSSTYVFTSDHFGYDEVVVESTNINLKNGCKSDGYCYYRVDGTDDDDDETYGDIDLSSGWSELYITYDGACTSNSECLTGRYCTQSGTCSNKLATGYECGDDITYLNTDAENNGACSSAYCRTTIGGTDNDKYCADSSTDCVDYDGSIPADSRNTGYIACESGQDYDYTCNSGVWNSNACADQTCSGADNIDSYLTDSTCSETTGCSTQTSTECATCETCSGTSCVNKGDNIQDIIGSNKCEGICDACQSGSCGNADDNTDPGNDCTATYTSCDNKYTLKGIEGTDADGYCDNAGACDTNDGGLSNVSEGNVCYNGVDQNPDITTNCGIWGDCVQYSDSANEYYVGYVGDGTDTCTDTDWQSSGTTWDATSGYLISVTEKADDCQESVRTSDAYNNISLVLDSGYAADDYTNVNLVFEGEAGNPDTNHTIWDGINWIQYGEGEYPRFRCTPTQTDCEPTNQNAGISQSIFRICNNGTVAGTSVYMNVNTTFTGIDLKCDDDYTSADATVLTTANQTIYGALVVDACIDVSCWADYNNPTSGGYFGIIGYVI